MSTQHVAPQQMPKVFQRWAMIQTLITLELLAPWKHGEELDDAVFQIAAVFPLQYLEHKDYKMPGDLLHPFDPNAFLQRLIDETGIAHTWKPVRTRVEQGGRMFSTSSRSGADPDTEATYRTRQSLWVIWERRSGRSDLKDHPEALAGFFADYLIENLDLVREVEASFRNGSPPFPSMEVLQQLEQRAVPKWIRDRFPSNSPSEGK